MEFQSIDIGDIIAGMLGVAALATYLWNGLGKPNKIQDEKITKLSSSVVVLQEDLKLIKVNHLPHIERDINKLSESMVRVETILEERLPRK